MKTLWDFPERDSPTACGLYLVLSRATYTSSVFGTSLRDWATFHVGMTLERVEFFVTSHLKLEVHQSGHNDNHGVSFQERQTLAPLLAPPSVEDPIILLVFDVRGPSYQMMDVSLVAIIASFSPMLIPLSLSGTYM